MIRLDCVARIRIIWDKRLERISCIRVTYQSLLVFSSHVPTLFPARLLWRWNLELLHLPSKRRLIRLQK